LEGFGDNRSLVSLYGSIVGLTKLGHSVIQNLLLPLMNSVASKINSKESISSAEINQLRKSAIEDFPTIIDQPRKISLTGGLKTLQTRAEDANVVENCKAAVLAALGKYMVTSMRLPSTLEVGLDSRPSKITDMKSSFLKSMHNEDSLVSEMAEVLVPYYISTSKQLDYCRLFL